MVCRLQKFIEIYSHFYKLVHRCSELSRHMSCQMDRKIYFGWRKTARPTQKKPVGAGAAADELAGCPICGSIQTLPALRGGGSVHCWRCNAVLERFNGRSVDGALACAAATLLLLFPDPPAVRIPLPVRRQR
jgi:hypothetical protein